MKLKSYERVSRVGGSILFLTSSSREASISWKRRLVVWPAIAQPAWYVHLLYLSCSQVLVQYFQAFVSQKMDGTSVCARYNPFLRFENSRNTKLIPRTF